MNKEIVFLSGVRTPFGALGGALKRETATDLAVRAAKGAMERGNIEAEQVDHCIVGNVLQSSGDAIYLARHVALRSGMAEATPALTVNRLCGSGFESVVAAAHRLLLGEAELVVAGGTESMTQAPHVLRGLRDGLRLGREPTLRDSLWEALYDPYADSAMALTAERLGQRYEVTREDCDRYAHRSQMAYRAALDAGKVAEEIVAVEVPTRAGTRVVDTDEHPRGDASLEAMLELPAHFKDGGLVTAGNASGIVDGAAALVVATADWAARHGKEPLGRLVGWGVAGCDPKVMGIGPVPATRQALQRAGMSLEQMELVEINEAFAPQYLAVERELGLDRERTNVNGGAIAVGHPLGATGTRIVLTLLLELRRRGGRFGLGSACIGGGQGITVIVEAFSGSRDLDTKQGDQ
jgi:acetyl-CoA acetyltransferase family protein